MHPLPGGPLEQRALGVLHASCGHCHRSGGLAWEQTALDLHLATDALSAPQDTGAYRTAVAVATDRTFAGVDARISPGRPQASAVYARMSTRDPLLMMPTIATELVDGEGSQAVHGWILAMPADSVDGGSGDAAADTGAAP